MIWDQDRKAPNHKQNQEVLIRPATSGEVASRSPRQRRETRTQLLLTKQVLVFMQTQTVSFFSASPDEGLEGGALRVDAQRNPFALLVLRDEAMDQLWNNKHR
ncbi:hypothetical protein GOODEAATRI_021736 [Goodea atripinnis]|uniref:Uncharacterized protein n=1 Tax=Goodea atripinnis TaxID=208336 RepID=A0ABV0P6U1_9TELE